jgi:hypothetical protein
MYPTTFEVELFTHNEVYNSYEWNVIVIGIPLTNFTCASVEVGPLPREIGLIL